MILYVFIAQVILCGYIFIMMAFDNLKLDEFRCVIDELQEIKIVKRLQDVTQNEQQGILENLEEAIIVL